MGLFRLNEDIHDVVNNNAEGKYQLRKMTKDFPKIFSKSDGLYSATKKFLNVARSEKPEKSGLLNIAKKKGIDDIKTLMHSPHKGTSDKFAFYKYDK